jgi:4-amino-4-deoxychorismate lyase
MPNWFNADGRVAEVVVDDRGLQYGDGLFETIAIRNGAPRLWDKHMARLRRGCDVIGIEMPPEPELLEGVLRAVEVSNVTAAYAVAKIILTAGTGLRGYGRVTATSPSVLFGAFVANPVAVKLYREGAEVALCETRLASSSALAGIKTLNRLEQVLARSEIIGSKAFEGLTMDADNNIICGTMSNVFFVQKNVLSTAALERCGVAGVMRGHVIESLSEQGIETQLRHTTSTELSEVDEIFLCNSQFGLIPVRHCGEQQWPVGELTRTAMAALAENGIRECRL